jgi:hypothetical protein
MNIIPSRVLIEALKMMEHAQSIYRSISSFIFNRNIFFVDLTILFIDSDLFPLFIDKNTIISHELDPTAR